MGSPCSSPGKKKTIQDLNTEKVYKEITNSVNKVRANNTSQKEHKKNINLEKEKFYVIPENINDIQKIITVNTGIVANDKITNYICRIVIGGYERWAYLSENQLSEWYKCNKIYDVVFNQY